MKPKILIVDDEADTVEVLEYNLRGAGYEVFTAADGQSALARARTRLPDLIVLDIMLPGLDGLEVCKKLRTDPKTQNIPVIMLTAKTAEIDRVLGLELGADDYVTKPFSHRELLLRVKGLLRRREVPAEKGDILRFGALVIDIPRHEVTSSGKPIILTPTEFRLLTLLAERRGRVQSREKLLHDVWNYDSVIDTRTVDTHVRRLREKLGSASKYLDTVRGVGYRFMEPAS